MLGCREGLPAPTMRLINIAPNPNCPPVELRVFHDLTPPHPVVQVRLCRPPGAPAWYDVTGWTRAGSPCPALLQKVDDSGEGVAWLLFGGDAGLRFKPPGADAPWAIENRRQWGEPFLLLTDLTDVRLSDPAVSTVPGGRHG